MALALPACRSGDLGPAAEPGQPAVVTITSGSGQSGPAGRPLARAIVARVTDAEGRGVAGQRVSFSTSTGSGVLTPTSAVTRESGEATAVWTLGTQAGPLTASATVNGLAPADFAATAIAGAPARLSFVAAPRAAVAGRAFDPPVAVVLEDEYGNRVPGGSRQVSLALNTGRLAGQTSVGAVEGLAAFPGLHIDSAGLGYVLIAVAEGLTGAETPAFPVASGVVDASRSTLTASPATVGTGEASIVTVTARDAFGNPVAGAPVELGASGSGNSIVQPSATGEGGSASGSISSSRAGRKSITARVGGVTLEEQVTVVVQSPAIAEVRVTPANATLLAGQTVDLSAVALDQQGDAIPGATIRWSSSDPDIARVSTAGRVTALAPGAASVTATSGDRSGAAEMTVSLNAGTLTDVTYCTVDQVAVKMDVYIPDASKPRPLPVAVHVHGGGWTGGSKSSGYRFGELMPLLLERGYLVASLDYRLAPAHRYPAQIEDVKCAIRHLRARASRYGLDPDRIGAWGGSAGGQLVSLLGTADASAGFDVVGGFPGVSSEVQAVVAISAITDFTRPDELLDDYSRVFRTWPDPSSAEMVEASPLTHVSTDDAPFLLIAGEDDGLVLPAQSRRLHQRLLDAGVPSTLIIVSNADHDLEPTDGPTDPSPGAINSRLADFFDRYLR